MDDQATKLQRLRELLSKPNLTQEEEIEKQTLLAEFKDLGLLEEDIVPPLDLSTSGVPNAALLSVLLGEYQESLSEQLETSLKPLEKKKREQLIFLLLLNHRRKLTKILQKELINNPPLSQGINDATTSKPELDFRSLALEDAQKLLNLKQESLGINLSPHQQNKAIDQLATDLVALSQITIPTPPPIEIETDSPLPPPIQNLETSELNNYQPEQGMVKKNPLASSPNLPDSEEATNTRNITPLEIAVLVDDALASVKKDYHSPLHDLNQKIEDILIPATDEDYSQFIDQQLDSSAAEDQTLLDPTTFFVIDKEKLDSITQDKNLIVSLPTTQEQETKLIKDLLPPNYKDSPVSENHFLTTEIQTHQNNNREILTQLITTSNIAPAVTGLVSTNKDLSHTLEQTLLKEIRKEDSTIDVFPSVQASTIAQIISYPQNRPHTSLDPIAIKLVGRNIPINRIVSTAKKILKEKQSLTLEEKKALTNLVKGAKNIGPQLQQELRAARRPRLFGQATGFSDGFFEYLNIARNNALRFAPGARGLMSPVGLVRSKLGTRIGSRLAFEYGSTLSPSVLRKGLGMIGSKGFSAASHYLTQKALVATGGKLAIRALAQTLNVVPGLGLLIDAAIQIGLKAKELFSKTFQNLAVTIWGERVRKIDLLGAGALAGGSIMGGFAALGIGAQAALAATFAAAGSAFITLFIAAAGTFILYISAMNIAPILSTLVHLESGLGVAGGTGTEGIPEGLELKSCWPTDGPITQLNTQAHLVYTRLGSKGTALDIGASWGDPVYAPIDGSFTYYSMGTGPLTSGAGNYGIIEGSGITIGLLHLSGRSNTQSTQVRAGVDIVGYVGNTGNSFGPHLHYEIWGANIDLVVPRKPQLFMSVSHTECVNLVGAGGTGTRVPGEPAIDCPAESEQIQYPGASVNFLTNNTRQNGCITPKQLVIHWSGGDPYQTTAAMTRSSLQTRGSGCAFAVDQNGVIQMMPLYNGSIQEGICSHQNNISIDIEISGRCFSTDNSTCGGTTATPPENHPSQGAQFMNNIVNLAEWIMDQYNIPCSAIKGHFETAPGLRDDPGRNWLNNSLKPRLGC